MKWFNKLHGRLVPMQMNKTEKSGIHNNFLAVILVQAILYTGLWLWNEYIASYLTLIFPSIILVILLIAIIADFIEPSRIPKWYYAMMICSILTPLLIGLLFYFLSEGQLDWLQ